MATRTGFRPRPLDTTRQLNIVRDVKELDDGEQKVSRDIVHSHEALDKDNEEVKHCTLGAAIPTAFRHAAQYALPFWRNAHDSFRDCYPIVLPTAFLRTPIVHHQMVFALRRDVSLVKASPRRARCGSHATCVHADSKAVMWPEAAFGLHRLAWCPASKPKVARKFLYHWSELCHLTALSICLYTRSPGCTSEAKVGNLISL